MIEIENTDVNIVRNLIPMRNLMPASAYGLKAISDWLLDGLKKASFDSFDCTVSSLVKKISVLMYVVLLENG